MSENLIKSGTVLQKAIVVFGDINKRINSLIECSARDFDTLNVNFQNFHKSIKDLTEQVSSFCRGICEIPEAVITDFEKKLTQAVDLINNGNVVISKIEQSVNKLEKSTEHGCLHANNFIQNTSTLKLLTTNIQFEPTQREHYKVIIEILNELTGQSKKLQREFQYIDKRVKSCSELVQHIQTHQVPIVLQLLEKIISIIHSLHSKRKEYENCNAVVNQISVKHASSSSAIITNLQFQDIIRQKIEHVREAHEAILEELSSRSKKNISKSDSEELNIELLFKIRDIGSLQTIQLVHANNEYQKAVENITEKFGELESTMQQARRLMQSVLKHNTINGEIKDDQLHRVFEEFDLEIGTLFELNSRLDFKYSDMSRKIESFLESKKIVGDVKLTIDKLSQTVQIIADNDEINKTIVSPLHQLLKNIQDLNKNISEIEPIVNKDISEFEIISKKVLEDNLTLFKKLENLTKQIRDIGDKNIPKNSIKLSGSRAWNGSDIKNNDFDLEKVKYYKIFDKEVEEIIAELNNLLKQMDFKNFESGISKENLARLKKMYTMESERKIHELYTGEKHSADNTDDTDDIELF